MNDNYMKTILSGVKEWTENLTDDAKDKANGTHKDWNENDPTKPGYIKNRPFYTGNPVETVLVEESTVPFTDSNQGFYVAQIRSNFVSTVGETYKVSWDGTVYECTCVEFSGGTIIGNLSIAGAGSDTGEPFVMNIMNGAGIAIGTADTSASHTFSISGSIAEVVKIDEKYLPDALTSKISTLSSDVSTLSSDVSTLSSDVSTLSNNASALSKKVSTLSSNVSSLSSNVSSLSSNVSSLSSSVNEKMNKSNPKGSGSFSLNRKANTTIGVNSFAEGYQTTASGKGSHAEGKETTASGDYSHAEGSRTTALSISHAEGSSTNAYSAFVTVEKPTKEDIITAWEINKFSVARSASHVEGIDNLAIGNFSHAEGKETTASGSRSHAEGEKTTASDIDSHAEGNGTTASGIGSHAEGEKTTTSGRASHAEGFQTTASGENSHAEGYFTIASSNYQHVQGKYNIEDSSGTYADIVGNGALGRRSNAYTLDWEGNAWYSGTIEGKALILPSSTAGSTKKFKITVDDSGTISATEVV